MKKLTIALLSVVLLSFSTIAFAAGQKPKTSTDSLRVKNQVKTQNKGEETQIRTREEKKTAEGDSAQVKEQNKVQTKNKGEDDKLRVRTEEGDKGNGTMEQKRYRDEDGDGIADSTQTKEKSKNRTRTQEKDNKDDEMTPKGGASGKKGGETPSEKGR